jgi:heat shock protein HslJ
MSRTIGIHTRTLARVTPAICFGLMLFTIDTATPVMPRGNPTKVAVMLRRAAVGQNVPKSAARPLEGTYWKVIELAGKPAPAQEPNREAHVILEGGRLAGSDGCNRIIGSYELKGDGIKFGQDASIQMACESAGGIERAFRGALASAARFTIVGDRLELLDARGKRVAALAGRAAALPPASTELEGTSWQLVRFQGGDDTTLTPDDGSKYTIAFDAGGQLTARLDCNRGRGTWKSSGTNQLQFGPLALTRAACPPGSLHDQIVKQWGSIRSYVIKDGHLFLSLMADGGIYEFAPLAATKPAAADSDLLARGARIRRWLLLETGTDGAD